MLATIKINSTFKDYFNELEYEVDINSYSDIEFYLRGVHPKFNNYIRHLQSGMTGEGFAYVNGDLKLIERQEYALKRIKEGEVIHLVPVVCGSGGKKGFIFAAIAIVAIAFMIPVAPMLASAPGMGIAGVMPGTSTLGGSLLSSFAGLPSFVKGIMGNLALSAIGALFTSKPKGKPVQVTKDSGTRTENNMFSSLTNTTESGTPIALNYGQMRVAGQFLSGYILSTVHDKGSPPSVESQFNSDTTPIAGSIGGDKE